MYSLLPEDLLSELTLSLLQLMMCRVAAVKHLPVHNHSADHIQSTLVISTSLISNNRLSRRENLILVLT